ncbi:MAG: MarR family transcriptional regulator [Solirubrobacterales bacterium]|nr:MarR family transcriptional regulator [Solirubrobacterales bacterium]
MERDSVDRMVDGWREVRPDLDVAPAGVVSRLARVRDHQDYAIESLLSELGLSGPTFAVLVSLARLDRPDGVPVGELLDAWSRPPSTLGTRVERLASQGIVEHLGGGRYRLTDQGRDLFERAAPAHLRNADRLLAPLSAEEREQLAGLLRKLLARYEAEDDGRP